MSPAQIIEAVRMALVLIGLGGCAMQPFEDSAITTRNRNLAAAEAIINAPSVEIVRTVKGQPVQ